MTSLSQDFPRLTRTIPAPKPGIVHLGPGAFFRAFNAVYTDEAMAEKGGDWGIIAVSLRSPTARDQLVPQGGVYHSVSLAPSGETYKRINSIINVLVAPENPELVLDEMSDPDTKIVSLTITEKGYCHEPSTGRLRLEENGIRHDLKNPATPQTAAGFIVESLARRKALGLRPFTVMSCDNLPDNGRLARGFVLDFARQRDPDLAEWIAAQGCFPSSMVDRITPATTPQDLARVAKATGVQDFGPVLHEPFRQWVIEDSFVDEARPHWEVGGAQFVQSVSDHEDMKLRCLNGTHSALAYLGYLAGHETIGDVVADETFAQYCKKLWGTEIVPTLSKPEGENLDAYCAALLERFENPAIRHRTWQIAMDGSQKLPQRMLGTIQDNLAAGRAFSGMALAVAGWMRYIGGVDEKGHNIDVRDPLAEPLKASVEKGATPSDSALNVLSIEDVFPADLAANATFRQAVTSAYLQLIETGARSAVKSYLNG